MPARITRIIDPYVFFLQVGFKGYDLGAKQRKDTLVPGRFSKLLIHRVIVIVAAPQNLNSLVSSKLNCLLDRFERRKVGRQMNVRIIGKRFGQTRTVRLGGHCIHTTELFQEIRCLYLSFIHRKEPVI